MATACIVIVVLGAFRFGRNGWIVKTDADAGTEGYACVSVFLCAIVQHSVAISGQLLLFCDQSMRKKVWSSRKRGA